MEEFSKLQGGDNANSNTNTNTARVGFIYGSSSSSVAPPSSSSSYHCHHHNYTMQNHHHLYPFQHHLDHHHPMPKPEGESSHLDTSHGHGHYPFGRRSGGGPLPNDTDAIKAKIISHPQYSSLLEAYMDCQKVGAPPEVVARLTAIAHDFEARQMTGRESSIPDPELDQFMEAYYDMLVKYREELTRPLQEAMDFLRRVESQLNTITNGSARVFSPDDKGEGVGSSDEEQDGSGGETELPEIDPRAEDKELKHHLLKKYSGYLGSLKQELSKKRKKGKLPKEARQKLLSWWESHYKWPYPSETEKLALAESTGLDQKQINNWFINQRKRHWKPSEDMQFVVMDGFHPQHAAAFYVDGHHHFMGDGSFRLGP